MKHILWLCSWYPNEVDKFRGDFVQRQAIATSQFCKIDVVHVMFCDEDKAIVNSVNENLTEHIFYVKKKSKVANFIFYYFIHQKIRRQFKKDIDLVHVQVPMNAGIIALFWKLLYNIPYVITEHYGIYNLNIKENIYTRSWAYKFFLKKIISNANLLTVVSKSLGEEMHKFGIQKEFKIIPNVVDTNLFSFQEPINRKPFRFIHISNMIPVKNVQGIIEAVEKLSIIRYDFEIHFVGRIVQDYLALAEEKKLLNKVIYFKGEITYNEVAQEVKDSHAQIIFSHSESQSCVVLESLCAGRPVIVTNVGGVKELVNDTNGYKVAVNQVDDLVNKMMLMIDNYSTFHCSKIASDAGLLYSYQAVGKQFDEIYKKNITA